MFLAIRFLDEAGEQIARKIWNVSGESPGWNDELASATLNHRREMLVVPAGAARFQVSISSGGPAGTVGIYVVDGLVVSKLSGAANNVVLRSPVGQGPPELSIGKLGPDWVRSGTRPSMAKVVEIGRNPATKALAIMDEDPFGHADWDSPQNPAPRVSPGEQLLLEWNEVYSMGMATDWYAMCRQLPDGNFRFCVAELTALGQPTGAQVSLRELCQQAQLPCRLHLCELPADVQVSSHTRHHMTLAVKEAVHNVIKHARASGIAVGVVWAEGELTVSIQDNGRGFSPDSAPVGQGLTNMKRRLAELGGTCAIQSEVGRGTTVELSLATGRQAHSNKTSVQADRGH
jgi:hypothetical protein